MMLILQFVATFSCIMFAGAALYINLAEHPARLECGTLLAATVFPPSYNRASLMQATLASISTVTALFTWMAGGTYLWLIGSLCIFFVIPFTFLAIMPINKQLKSTTLDKSSPATRLLLISWGNLHAVRTIASLLASSVFLYTILNT